jgi:hypothetical protein
MEQRGLINRSINKSTGDIKYTTTEITTELKPIVHALGKWAHRNIDADVTLEHLDVKLLMWNMRRRVNSAALPRTRQSVIQFIYPELPKDEQSYWLIAKPGMPVDLCSIDPSYEVDLYITADLKAMTSAWMGHSSLQSEIAKEKIALIGNHDLAVTIGEWMVGSSYAAA